MTTKDFLQRIGKYKYLLPVQDNNSIRVYYHTYCIAKIDKNKSMRMKLYIGDVKAFSDAVKEGLFELFMEYARTPIGERESAKRYRFYCKINDAPLVMNKKTKQLKVTEVMSACGEDQDTFSEEEVETMKENYGEDCLNGFTKIEAEWSSEW